MFRVDGDGWRLITVWDFGLTLVLDRRDSGDAISGHGHDAVLLHLEDPLRAWISPPAIRRGRAGAVGDLVCTHDNLDEWRQYVRHGAGNEDGAGMEHHV